MFQRIFKKYISSQIKNISDVWHLSSRIPQKPVENFKYLLT